MKRAFLLREWGSVFFRVLFWLNNFLHSGQLNILPTWVCLWLQSAPLVANDFGHKSQELSFVIRTSQLSSWLAEDNEGIDLALQRATLTTFPFARIRVFCNFTSWLWMINLLVLGWESPNHQNKWENDFLLDIFYCWQWFWYSQLEKLTHIQIASSQSQKPCSIPLHQDL